ncbi:hypothetical protein Csp2054_02660 [Curtobacterium sp. 'Ferrero']|uniref:TetR/AcrR family transcriptional regulator n=1 Tax=Curtobacterium sp. 'Ferrero' TaxID=2033654 RepID=UPI000BCA72BB|nr:TetR/AcrR family transcriptional regulator [Curtobacterium sp. 'Ferrero']PCN49116.1 hypothetical protein Csp2054_02660 [Curtobacterium sp. 'Ferrero']
MPRKPDPTLKPAIVAKVADHLRDTKLEDVSVRSLGRVLGTSAYPIVYHFGSREALIQAVVEHLHRSLDGVTLRPDADDGRLRAWFVTVFGGLDDPERALAVRLSFELGSVEELDGRVRERTAQREHLEAVAAWCRAHGTDAFEAERAARAAVYAARGAQWAAIVDPGRTEVDQVLQGIADDLVASVELATV